MSVKAVLFDLDGTLLPMDQDVFIKAYFKGLSTHLAPHGYDPKQLVGAVWAGTESMIKNDGAKTNEEAFWDTFCQLMGEHTRQDEPKFDAFYRTEFDKVKEVCGFDPNSAKIIQKLKSKGVRLVLATNPIFPAIATQKRMSWAGLDPQDFEIYTTYENIGLCKPNPEYYLELTQRLGVDPTECLMVGNDVGDDMVASTIGMKTFLLTDNLINKTEEDISSYPNGGFDELNSFIDQIMA